MVEHGKLTFIIAIIPGLDLLLLLCDRLSFLGDGRRRYTPNVGAFAVLLLRQAERWY